MSRRKILVLGPSWVGDMVLAHSLFQSLKTQYPDSQIDVLAPAWTLPLLDRMPEVSAKITLPFNHGELALLDRIKFGRILKNQGYTQSILLVNSLKSAVVPFMAGIRQRTGFLGEMRYGLVNDIRPLDKAKYPRTVDRFVFLGLDPSNQIKSAPTVPLNIQNPRLIANCENALKVLSSLGGNITTQPKILGLCPGAEYGEAKRWPAEHYAQVAQYAINKGWQVWLFGSDKDVSVTAKINQLTKNGCLNLGGETKLGDAIDLMSLCDTVISNDSGLMHIAAALDKKVIGIYGSSNPQHTPPMHPQAVIEYLRLDCSPCFKRECPLKNATSHLACLKNIQPTQIIAHLK